MLTALLGDRILRGLSQHDPTNVTSEGDRVVSSCQIEEFHLDVETALTVQVLQGPADVPDVFFADLAVRKRCSRRFVPPQQAPDLGGALSFPRCHAQLTADFLVDILDRPTATRRWGRDDAPPGQIAGPPGSYGRQASHRLAERAEEVGQRSLIDVVRIDIGELEEVGVNSGEDRLYVGGELPCGSITTRAVSCVRRPLVAPAPYAGHVAIQNWAVPTGSGRCVRRLPACSSGFTNEEVGATA